MRIGLLVLLTAAVFGFKMCGQSHPAALFVEAPTSASKSSSADATTRPDFDKEIKPILQARCQPCHFQGGKVYDKLPFDRPDTIKRLGTKLFTRIKNEKEQKLIRDFLQ